MRISSRRLGEHLVERRVLSRDLLDELLAREAAEGTPLQDLLLAEGAVSERDVTAAVAEETGVPYVDLSDRTILGDAWGAIPEDLARGYLAVAIERRADGYVVAFEDPSDERVRSAVEEDLGAPVEAVLAARDELQALVDAIYGQDAASGTEDERARDTRPALQLDDLLRQVLQAGASDLHLAVGAPPVVRVRGELRRLEAAGTLNGSEVRRLLDDLLTPRQKHRLLSDGQVQTSHALAGAGRFRVHAFVQRSSVGAVFRLVPATVPTPEQLGLPAEVAAMADSPSGLVLACGPSGSGTSTTVAALVDRINRSRACHVLTLEDPIEFLHRHGRAIVNQREIGEDTADFAGALRGALRQDADVIVVGEVPDLDTMRLVLAGAETGHLVVAVLRAPDTASALERVVDSFPPDQRPQARVQLATTFRGATAQRLVPRVGGGMAVACEVLLPAQAVLDAIRSGDLATIPTAIVSGAGSGMCTLDQALAGLVKDGLATADAAAEQALDPDEVRYLLSSDEGA